MSEQRLELILRDPQRGHTEWVKAWQWVKAMVMAFPQTPGPEPLPVRGQGHQGEEERGGD